MTDFFAVLQWGHGIAAVESVSQLARALTRVLLQWGHGIAAVESVHSAFWNYKYNGSLQWGHGIAAVESVES